MAGDIYIVKPTITSRSNTSSAAHSTTTYNTSKTQDTVRHELTDDGLGTLGPWGSVNYATKTITARLVDISATTEGYASDSEDAATFEETTMSSSGTPVGGGGSSGAKGRQYSDATVGEEVLASATLTVTHAVGASASATHTMTYRPPTVTIDLCPYTADYIVPNSVMFTWMGHVYIDIDGIIYRDRTGADAGFVAGQLDYSSGIAEIFDYVVDGLPTAFVLNSLFTVRQNWTTASIFMRTLASPVKPTQFVLNLSDTQGNQITATGDLNGNLTGPHLRGRIEYQTGIAELNFGDFVTDALLTPFDKLEWWYNADDVGAVQPGKIWRPYPVDPTTLRYNSVTYVYLPMDAALLGLDPVRLPPDGRVVIFQRGEFAVLGFTVPGSTFVAAGGQTYDIGHERLSTARVIDVNGLGILTGYTVDLDAGTLTVQDVTGWAQPVRINARVEVLRRINDVQIGGRIGFTAPIGTAFDTDAILSSALMAGDLYARVSRLFDQFTWDGKYNAALVGDSAAGTYNDTAYPLLVTNLGALNERWVCRFRNSTEFDFIGEHIGQIASGTINADFAPVNPAAGVPYLVIRALGWGAGWVAGNVLRIDTVAAGAPIAVVRTTQPGSSSALSYSAAIEARGDVDRPPSNPIP